MNWSALNGLLATQVSGLLDNEYLGGYEPQERAISREMAEGIIHAALWLYASRGGSTASAYAMANLMDVMGIESWQLKTDQPSATQK